MNKFGPHFQRYTREMKDLIAHWQPPVVVWVDPNRYGVEEIRSISPDTFIIGRKFEEGSWDSPNLKDRACWWADECAKMGPCDAYVVWNEPISHDDKNNFGRLDDFHMWFRERILTHGMEAVGLNVGTGNFTKLDDIAACFPQTCATFKHLGIHEYDWIVDPARRPADADRLGYYWNRWPYWLEAIGRDDVALWVTECGMTQAVHEGRPDEGWRSGADGMTDGDYIEWADWYNRQLAEDGRLGGAALFNFAGYGWETFEHLGWERLGEILALDAPEPNGNGGGKVRVFDMDGTELFGSEAEALVTYHGLSFEEPVGLQDGELYFALVALREKTGNTAFIFRVCNEDGSRRADQECAWWWPDMSSDDNDIVEAYATDWHAEADLGVTKEDGEMGPSMGTGAYHGKNTPGPHHAWVRHASIPSVLLRGIGMIAGTNHDHMDGEWQLREYETGGNGGEGHAEQLRDIAEDLCDRADVLFDIADELENGGGGVDRIVLHWKSGATQDFKAVQSATRRIWALLARALGR